MRQDSISSKSGISRSGKIAIWTLVSLVLIIVILFVVYSFLVYPPSDVAKEAMKSDEQVSVMQSSKAYRFEPAGENAEIRQPGIIFYPGGLVEPQSYAPMARQLAEAGHRVYIASMPLNLAFTAQNRADELLAEHPDESFVIGGHSLGGVFAARYAASHPNAVDGVFFLASYADEKGDLKDAGMPVLQISATNDQVMNAEDWEAAKPFLPADTTYVSIEGGNHGQFGSYGEQKGDRKADITGEEQTAEVSAQLLDWLDRLAAE
jgi:pimeloyl-ACP methyl ester carboxylesterase